MCAGSAGCLVSREGAEYKLTNRNVSSKMSVYLGGIEFVFTVLLKKKDAVCGFRAEENAQLNHSSSTLVLGTAD